MGYEIDPRSIHLRDEPVIRRGAHRKRNGSARAWCCSATAGLTGPVRDAARGGAQAMSWAAGDSTRPPSPGAASAGQCSGAISADDLAARLSREAAAMVHEKAAGAGELVGLLGHDAHSQFVLGQVRQVGAG